MKVDGHFRIRCPVSVIRAGRLMAMLNPVKFAKLSTSASPDSLTWWFLVRLFISNITKLGETYEHDVRI